MNHIIHICDTKYFFLKSLLMNKTITLICFSVCLFLIILVTNTTLTFASTESSSSIGTMRLNQDLFEVSAGSPQMLKLSGKVPSANRGDKITVIFTMPDGKTKGSQIFPTKDGLFETFMSLDNYSQLGTYSVFASFNSASMGSLTFSVMKKQFSVINNVIPSLPTPKYFNEFTFETNKNSYSDGEKVRISGHVEELLSQTPVILQLLSPNGNLITIAQIQVGADGTFNTEFTSGGPTWTSQGTYTIKALYGSNSRTAETTFYFNGTTKTSVTSQISGTSINVQGHNVDFQITSGKLLDITPDVDANSLIISIDAAGDGSLTLTIPRSVLDATINGGDDDFFVLIEGKKADFDETTTSTDRTLTIAFPAGAEEIEIIGTQVMVPTVTQPKITYYDTQLSLQVKDSSSQGYINVKPTLTYSSGNNPPTNDISVYVDGTYKTKVTSNQWSSNIYAGSGADHTIKASVLEMTSSSNTSIKYRASSDTVIHFVKASSTPTPSSSGTSSESFPIVYVIVGIVIIVIVLGIGITLSKRKKTVPVIVSPHPKTPSVQTAPDETQFWVCPHCGGDTQYKYGKQFCGSCKTYL